MPDSIPLRIDCTHPNCTRCVAQIVDGVFRFRSKHDGQTHDIELPLAALLRILAASIQPVEVPVNGCSNRIPLQSSGIA